jgi:hypothetical protein
MWHRSRLLGAVELDARDLSVFPDACFDAVACGRRWVACRRDCDAGDSAWWGAYVR